MDCIVQDISDVVICDYCNKDWTDDPTPGGGASGSYAICPDCWEHAVAQHKYYHEEDNLVYNNNPEMSWYRFVIDVLRNGQPGIVEYYPLDSEDDMDALFEFLTKL